jgi:hypothetical protein
MVFLLMIVVMTTVTSTKSCRRPVLMPIHVIFCSSDIFVDEAGGEGFSQSRDPESPSPPLSRASFSRPRPAVMTVNGACVPCSTALVA